MNPRTQPHSWLRVTSLAVIAAVIFGLLGFAGAPGGVTAVPLAYADKIDKEVIKALASSPDGKAAVFAVLGEQADLTAANAHRGLERARLGRLQRAQRHSGTHTAGRHGATAQLRGRAARPARSSPSGSST